MSQYGYISHSELAHHGVKGQRWGVRRYQNPDGSLTPEGKRKYGNLRNFHNAQAAKKAKIKKAALIGGSAAGLAALAVGGGIGIHKMWEDSKHNAALQRIHRKIDQEHAAQAQYKETNKNVEHIKNNKKAHHQGGQRAQYLRQNRIISGIANNPNANHQGGQRAQYLRQNRITSGIANNPNANHSGNQFANSVLFDQAVDRINKNKNAYHVGNKYAKKPGQR